jgi:hypothetical protein
LREIRRLLGLRLTAARPAARSLYWEAASAAAAAQKT